MHSKLQLIEAEPWAFVSAIGAVLGVFVLLVLCGAVHDRYVTGEWGFERRRRYLENLKRGRGES